jgi:putative transposase
MNYNPYKRQGQMDHLQSYFYTDTICEHKHLLIDDKMKMVIINSWKYLTETNKIKIYAFVIMPNHIHLIWKMLNIDINGKESAAGSFAKFTAHQFKKILEVSNPTELEKYRVDKADRQYQFWKRDPLAIALTFEASFTQRLEYVHNNPVKEKWQLADLPENYRWSSARFYENGFDEFGIVSDYRA